MGLVWLQLQEVGNSQVHFLEQWTCQHLSKGLDQISKIPLAG
jgi:hypothetical protein